MAPSASPLLSPAGPRPTPVMVDHADDLADLNTALRTLAAAFPNVRPEVFREMLTTLSRESRAEVVAEHLLRDEKKWVKGRWRTRDVEAGSGSRVLAEVREAEEARDGWGGWMSRRWGAKLGGRRQEPGPEKEGEDEDKDEDSGERAEEHQVAGGGAALVPVEETFRTPSYRSAVTAALRQEFKSLSRSTISAVLAEQNCSYTLARPILLGLAAKTWRASFSNMVSRLIRGGRTTAKSPMDETHWMLQWAPGSGTDKALKVPLLRQTGNDELDFELRTTILEPLLRHRRDRENAISMELALLLNEHEAEQAGAMYECQVCFADTTFEQIAMCTSASENHAICFGCIQRSVAEALYGQSWDLNIDHVRGQVACIAPSSHPCDGCIPYVLAQRAILAGIGGTKVWNQLEIRLAQDALRKSGAPLVQCPFCPYAEVDALHLPGTLFWELSISTPLRTSILLFLALDIAVVTAALCLTLYLLLYLALSPLSSLPSPSILLHNVRQAFHRSLITHSRRTLLPQRFTCRNPTCARASCIDCHKSWRDIHKCHESTALSLRRTVEAARTAALKRTCPRCGIGFVKASGCNKMVCVCGYSMCYVCRQGLGVKGIGGVLDGPGEGYAHFCQHFRPTGGRCSECEKCDLYKAEDEDEIVKRAGERAEKEWRDMNQVGEEVRLRVDRRGMVGVKALGITHDWTLQGWMDWWVSQVLVCKIKRLKEASEA